MNCSHAARRGYLAQPELYERIRVFASRSGTAPQGSRSVHRGTMRLTSATVMQSLLIPALGGRIYAMGGMVTQLHLEAGKPGRFMGENTMYNGSSFSQEKLTAAAMTRLYVTSATDKLTPEQRRREPLARALLRLRPGETGVARPYLLR